eukprot:4053116-Alexandrium_andersonii.AAC.1
MLEVPSQCSRLLQLGSNRPNSRPKRSYSNARGFVMLHSPALECPQTSVGIVVTARLSSESCEVLSRSAPPPRAVQSTCR